MSMMGCIYFKENDNTVPIYIDTLVKTASQLGSLCGQIIFGVLSDKKGRKTIYGVTLIIIIMGTLGSALSGNLGHHLTVFTILAIWRLFLGLGLGGDYPLSAVITSEFASTRHRGAMIASVFAMQGFGIVAVCLMTIMWLAIFRGLIYQDQDNLDYVWRIVIGIGGLPAIACIYFRFKITETPRYTIEITEDIERNKAKTKAATFKEFCAYFREWKNLKVLLGTSVCWFCLDVGFYGINLNSSIIIQAIGFSGNFTTIKYLNATLNNGTNSTMVTEVYPVLFNNAVGGIILALLGLLPGYWVAVALIDRIGRKPIQITGFAVLTIILAILAGLYNQIRKYSLALFIVLFTVAQFFHNFGPNTTTFVIPGEVFATEFRSTAHGISAASGKLGAIITQVGFLRIKDSFGGKDSGIPVLFGIFSGFMFVGLLFTFLLPETKGKSLEEISGIINQHSNLSEQFSYADCDNQNVETHF